MQSACERECESEEKTVQTDRSRSTPALFLYPTSSNNTEALLFGITFYPHRLSQFDVATTSNLPDLSVPNVKPVCDEDAFLFLVDWKCRVRVRASVRAKKNQSKSDRSHTHSHTVSSHLSFFQSIFIF